MFGLLTLTLAMNAADARRVQACSLAAGPNFRVAEYLPGELAARQSDLVISNGGSTTGYQALAQGRPVIGIPFNLDQYLAMQAIDRYGAGVTLRSGSLSAAQVRAAVALVLSDARYQQRASRLAQELASYDAEARFADFVDLASAPRVESSQATTRKLAPRMHA